MVITPSRALYYLPRGIRQVRPKPLPLLWRALSSAVFRPGYVVPSNQMSQWHPPPFSDVSSAKMALIQVMNLKLRIGHPSGHLPWENILWSLVPYSLPDMNSYSSSEFALLFITAMDRRSCMLSGAGGQVRAKLEDCSPDDNFFLTLVHLCTGPISSTKHEP